MLKLDVLDRLEPKEELEDLGEELYERDELPEDLELEECEEEECEECELEL